MCQRGALDRRSPEAEDERGKASRQSHSAVARGNDPAGDRHVCVLQFGSAMTYANEYRLGRRAYHYGQEESLAFALAVVVVIVVAAGYYILWNRFHIRPAQLVELSLYALYG